MGRKSTALLLIGLIAGVAIGIALSKKERRELFAEYVKRLVKKTIRHRNRQYDETETRRATDQTPISVVRLMNCCRLCDPQSEAQKSHNFPMLARVGYEIIYCLKPAGVCDSATSCKVLVVGSVMSESLAPVSYRQGSDLCQQSREMFRGDWGQIE